MIYLFGGQGSQLPEMGQDLLTFPEAKAVYDIAFAIHPDLEQILELTAEELGQTKFSQPAIALHQLALVRIMEEHGRKPDAVMGLSIGEFAALYAAGFLTLDDVIHVVLERARLMSERLETRGEDGMLAVLGPKRDEIETVLEEHPKVSLANINSPTQHVLSGALEDLHKIEADFTQARLVYLDVEGAFHSQVFDPCIEPFRKVLNEVRWQEPRCFMPLNRTGEEAREIVREMAEQLARPLEVDACFDALLERSEEGEFVEFAAKPVLLPLLKRKNRRLDMHHIGTAEAMETWLEERA